jgi:hypothetical protein
MKKLVVESRESLYLLSIELIILYVVAFGLLSLKTDNMFSLGMAYYALLYTFLLAYILPAVGLLFAAIGSERAERTAMAGARGASVFVVVAFWLLVVLMASLWSSPVVCVYETDSVALCHVKGDAVSQKVQNIDVRFMFPSRAQYAEYGDLANATVADVFLKTSLTENDIVTKIHAVVALALVFVILVVQMSFFFAVCCLEDDSDSEVFSAADLFSLFVRCAVLLLSIVIDTTDFFGDWNVVDVGPQMLPSLAFTSLLIFCDFCDTIMANRMQTWTRSIRIILVYSAETVVSFLYAIFAVLVACHYVVGGFAFMRDVIIDTRWTIVHVLFIVSLMLDACLALARCLFKLLKHGLYKHTVQKQKNIVQTGTPMSAAASTDAFHTTVDLSNMTLVTNSKKNR